MEIEPNKFCQQVLEEINYVRANPRTYAKRIRSYINSFDGMVLRLPGMNGLITTEGPSAYEEAALFLENTLKKPMLQLNEGLYNASIGMVNELKLYQDINEMYSLDRNAVIAQYGTFEGEFGQSTDFGSMKPELVVMNFLVDDGDKARRNRELMFKETFKSFGSATIKHPKYRMCTVVMYAKNFVSGKAIPVSQKNPKKFDLEPDTQYENYLEDEMREIHNTQPKTQSKSQPLQINKPVQPKSIPQYDKEQEHEEETSNEEIDLPPGVIKMEKNEKIIMENGIKKKLIKIIKYKETGEKQTEMFKENA